MNETTVRHTCTPDGRALPFGRKAPAGECPRCDELRAGATPRTFGWVERRARDARVTTAELRAHDCRTSRCGLVCTAFDW